jgi:hypothetical protein
MRSREESNSKKPKLQELLYSFKITQNVNGVDFPVERHRLIDWIKKTRPKNLLPRRNALIDKNLK